MSNVIPITSRAPADVCENDCVATRECTYCQGVADLLWFEGNGQWHVCVDCVKDGKLDTEAGTWEQLELDLDSVS